MSTRVLETVLVGTDRLSPVLGRAGANVAKFNGEVTGSNTRAASSATASAATQSRAHAAAAESATASSRAQQAANNALIRSNGLVGNSLTPLTAGLGAVALGLGYAAYRGMEFDTSMSRVQAATQASTAEMGRLRQSAIQLGADTQFSATEAADGITALAKAGVATGDILSGGLKGALDLAAAGEMAVGDAAEVAATALTTFHLAGAQVPHVADLLAAGAGKAQGSVADLGMALNQSALVASATGLSIEETTGSLAAFASAGLIGSDAGTSFRTMLLHLQNPSKEAAGTLSDLGISVYDAKGQFVGMESLAGQLQTRMAGLTQQQRDQAMATIFGSDAVRAANVLYTQGSQGIAEWTAKVNDAGYASRQAAQLNDNLRGDLERLGGAVDAFFTSLGQGSQGPLREVVQMLTHLVDGVSFVVHAFGSLPAPLQAALTGLVAVKLLGGPLNSMMDALAPRITGLATGMGMAALNSGGFSGALSNLIGMINPAMLGVGLAAAAFAEYSSQAAEVDAKLSAARDAGNSFRSTLVDQGGQLNDTTIAAAALAVKTIGLSEAFDDAGISAREVAQGLNGGRDAMNQMRAAAEELDRQAAWSSGNGGFFGLTEFSIAAVSGKLTENRDALDELIGHYRVGKVDAGGWGDAMKATADAADQTALATYGLGDAAALTDDQVEEAKKALEDWRNELQQIGGAFVDPLAAYKGLLEEKTQAERAAAEETASSTESTKDSWRDYVSDVSVSLDELAAKLEEQVQAHANWETNVLTITQRGGLEVGQAIAAMGEEGVQLAAQMANGTDAEFQRMAALIVQDTRNGSEQAAAELDTGMKIMAAIGAAGAGATVQGIAAQLQVGADQVRRIASQYGLHLAEGIDPLLAALGKPGTASRMASVQSLARQNGLFDGGYTGPGGKYEPAGFVHRGEIVWSQEDIAAHGGVGRVESMRLSRNGYANGGFVTAADVPSPSSTAPYQMPLSTAADATMQKGFDEVRAWLTANAGTAGGGAVGGDWQSIFNWVKARVPEARANSTYRPGDPGYHGRGKAVDFGFGSGPGGAGSAGLALINRVLHDGIGRNLAELIYDGLGDDRPDLWHGGPHTYNAKTQADHRNHVHAAVYDQGGPLYPGYTLAYNGTGRTEWVDSSPTAMPGYGAAGGPGAAAGGAAPNVTVLARVFVGTTEITDIVRVEATAVLTADRRQRSISGRST